MYLSVQHAAATGKTAPNEALIKLVMVVGAERMEGTSNCQLTVLPGGRRLMPLKSVDNV